METNSRLCSPQLERKLFSGDQDEEANRFVVYTPGTVLALNVRDDCGLFLEDDDGY